jgi:hypothetical protein
MFGPHHATPLENGNIQVFDNGAERPKGDRSRVLEVDPKTGEIVWEFVAKTSQSFYTNRQGAAQRLPNGNVLIKSSGSGHIFEVTPKKEVVWDYCAFPRLGRTQNEAKILISRFPSSCLGPPTVTSLSLRRRTTV